MASKALARQRGNEVKKEGLALYLERIRQGPEAEWTKDELLTCVHWQKQITAAILGLICGVLPLTGLEGFVTFLALQLVSTMVFYRMVLRVNEEVHGGAAEALADGFPTFTAIFVLLWVLTYNLLHVTSASATSSA
ncbi:hypothetical protein VOLCADRAFT_105763 [Volvox carteri f. nagariensis]|uniref:Rab5-interacting protein n=1 Tax=Volvox carteri f. nagariensis TaxID=3068 RepID=D8U2W8_VOLCA|nr:uncharacterized protein VOLCADRAFT_105763 [Volvox carteri f. nagariensis]EFJ45972.1 hypothetical protein VOLCADRAFT_105763 [Volvox carteri f. nagariensis]|eukprot:XP_002953050.1 hypothetical protein VOLCADRAFT_105763 [Volvox carteri f. nagariensis]